jgi:hypothetical protein
MKRMATTGTSAGVTTPRRETVGGQNHPLGVANTGSPASRFVDADPSSPTGEKTGIPAPGPITRSWTRVLVGNTVAREAEDEIEETEGEGLPEDSGLSEQETALSDGESSFGDDSQVMGPPNLQELVRLGQEHCSTPFRVKNKDGVHVPSICGKIIKDCQWHAEKRSGAKSYQYAPGSYPHVAVACGFTGHGLSNGTVYSDAQLKAYKAEEAEEMENLVQNMNENFHFKASKAHHAERAQPEKTTPTKEDSTNSLGKALAAKTAGPRMPQGSSRLDLWFGIITCKGDRWITVNPAEANEAVTNKRCRIAHVFHNIEDAEAWLENELPDLVLRTHSDSDSDSDDGNGIPDVKEIKKMSALACRRLKKQVQKARKRHSASGQNPLSDH